MSDSTEENEIATTLAARGDRYGRFIEHAKFAQNLQNIMRSSPNWNTRMEPDVRQALTVISDKIARILNGDPEYDDNWRDIAGYATLVLERIQGKR